MKNFSIKLLCSILTTVGALSPISALKTSSNRNEIVEEIQRNSNILKDENRISFNGLEFSDEISLDNYLIKNNFVFERETIEDLDLSNYQSYKIDESKIIDWEIENYNSYFKSENGVLTNYKNAAESFFYNLNWTKKYSYEGNNWYDNIDQAKNEYFDNDVQVRSLKMYKLNDNYFNPNNKKDIENFRSRLEDVYVIFKSKMIPLEEDFIFGSKEDLKSQVKQAVKKNFFKKIDNYSSDEEKYLSLNYYKNQKEVNVDTLDFIPGPDDRFDFFYPDTDGKYERYEGGKLLI
ncbi:hypothetical protein [Spiroplasma alleghenense]|uniref:Uncharacterized protein n=1 Tax=Spiroplasma alleghenense TaxID=216931 RepID=A0A345Z3N0_9MOLU|nr:hypothetical protein [Spiroplasma alleghenense]AXK51209.1 hypothetical protein SALLE_v1c05350 [Spiroplasma alleghenense]